MAFRIVRNDAGNCINFFGASNPTYWNACLEGEINSDNQNNVNVVNKIRSIEESTTVYEFFDIPFTEFIDKEQNPFENASECAQYITDNANVIGDQGSFIFSESDTLDAQRETTNTTVLFSNGDIFAVNALHATEATNGTITVNTIKGDRNIYTNLRYYNLTINDGDLSFNNISAAVNRLNEVLSGSAISSDSGAVEGTASTDSVAGTFTIYGDRITPDGSGGYTSTLQVGNFDTSNGMYSNQTISEPGEFFEFTQTGGDWSSTGAGLTVGLFDETTYNVGDLDEDVAGNKVKNVLRLRLKNSPFVFFDPSGIPRINENGFKNSPDTKERFRLGLDLDNVAYIAHEIVGSGYQTIARTETALPSNTELRFNVIMPLTNSLDNVGNFTVNTLNDSPLLTWYYIESPDGAFHYPLFQTQQEAKFADSEFGSAAAGSGVAIQHMYTDESPVQNLWFMPQSYGFEDQNSAPVNSSGLIYNEIATAADTNFVPASFGSKTLTVEEGAVINYPIKPADDAATYSVTNIPAGLAFSANGFLIGNAPQVSGDALNNPNDVYVMPVTKANEFGSSVGSLTLTVTNLQADVDIGSWSSGDFGSIANGVLQTNSTADLDLTLSEGFRIAVPKEWVDAHIIPNNIASGEATYLGLQSSSAAGTITDVDFAASLQWKYASSPSSHVTRLDDNLAPTTSGVDFTTTGSSLYDYALEIHEGKLYLIGCNLGDIMTQPSVANGGMFSRTLDCGLLVNGSDNYTEPISITLGTGGGSTVDLDDSLTDQDITKLRTPFGIRDILVGEWSNGVGHFAVQPTASDFDTGSYAGQHAPDWDEWSYFGVSSLSAGQTYRFIYHPSMEANDDVQFLLASDGTTPYTSGVTAFDNTSDGDPKASEGYKGFKFTVPSDAPPLTLKYRNNGVADSGRPISINGSTYVAPPIGINLEGPAANQTGTNVMDAGEHGWISLDEQLSAGERLVLDNAFFDDFLAETKGNNTIFAIGLKGNNWANTTEINSNGAGAAVQNSETFRSNTYIVGIWSSSASNLSMWIFADGVGGNMFYMNSSSLYPTTCAFLEITSDGNNIRAGMGRNNSTGNITQGDESTVAYADWNAYKKETVNRTLGISSIDVVISFWTYDGGAIDGSNIDWTGLSEVSVPTPAVTLTTNWNKALDFSGSSERTQMVNSSYLYNPLNMGNISSTTSIPVGTTYSSNDTNARPWATAVVFSSDNNSSNQHIWNNGEGAGSTDDNIYVRVDANRNLYFGWGRSGALNECSLGTLSASAGTWYGLYIAHNGTRLSGSHSSGQIASHFDIHLVNLSTGAVGSNLSTSSNWTSGSFGARMDRQFSGSITIGGRGSNRNFHGKVAAMVSTTLMRNAVMPTDAEISMMVRDPMQWLTDYRVGQTYRHSSGTTTSTFALSSLDSSYATQIWLMGDGTGDAYAQIRNQVYPGTQNNTPMNMISMVSNDIETVNISGLT